MIDIVAHAEAALFDGLPSYGSYGEIMQELIGELKAARAENKQLREQLDRVRTTR